MSKATLSRKSLVVTIWGLALLACYRGVAAEDEYLAGDGPPNTASHLASFQAPPRVAAANAVNARITQINIGQFPTVQVAVSVFDQNGIGITGLTRANFALTEQGPGDPTPVPEQIDVTPISGVISHVNIAIVFDRSGSMSGSPIAAAKTAAKAFVDNFTGQDRTALISFASNVTTNQAFLFTDAAGKATIKTKIDALSASGMTALVDGTLTAVNLTAAEAGTKAVIVFTDGQENYSSHTLQQLVNTAAAANIPIYTIGLGSGVDTSFLRTMANSTGGHYYYAPQASDLSNLYNQIRAKIAAQYLLVYRTHNPLEDGTVRTVTTTVTVGNDTAADSKTYTAHLPPRILLTQETINLSFFMQPESHDLLIRANVLAEAPITGVSLYYRQTGSGAAYTQAPMSLESEHLYRAAIPAAAVKTPGVDYYILATDGVLTATEPPLNPQDNPRQIPVGHTGFTIAHVPVLLAPYGTDITITARITDVVGSVTSATLFFRHASQNLYQSIDMGLQSGNNKDGVYVAAVPGSIHSGPPGSDYYIEATDSDGLKVAHGSAEAPHRVNYRPTWMVLSAAWDRNTHVLRLKAWAFDPTNGVPVTIGQGSFVIYDSSAAPVRTGSLAYDAAVKYWVSAASNFAEEGAYVFEATINGLTGRLAFSVGLQKTQISGTVTDTVGSPVAGATVRLVNQVLNGSALQWNELAQASSDAAGAFNFPERDAGVYWLKAQKINQKGQAGPFYAVGPVSKEVRVADFSAPFDSIDDLTRRLLSLMDSQVARLSDESKDVDAIVSGSDIWSKGLQLGEFLKLCYDVSKLCSHLIEWKNASSQYYEWKQAAEYWRQAKQAGDFEAVLWKSGAANVMKYQAQQELMNAGLKLTADEIKVSAKLVFKPLVLESAERQALEDWATAAPSAIAGRRLGLPFVVALTFDEQLRDYYEEMMDRSYEPVSQSVDFLVPASVPFNGNGCWLPFLCDWPLSDRNHYRSPEQIKQNAPVYDEVRALLASPNTGLCEAFKADLATLNVSPNTDMEVLRDVFAWYTNQVDLVRDHAGHHLLTLYGEPLPISLNDSVAVYRASIDHVNAILAARTLKLALDVGVAVTGVATGGVAAVAYAAVSTTVGLGLQALESEARMQVMGHYVSLANDWALMQMYMPAVLERAYSYTTAEIVDPCYAVTDASTKFRASIDNVNIHEDWRSIFTGRKYIWNPLGLGLFIGEHDLDFRISNAGSSEAHFQIVVENRIAQFLSGDYSLSDWKLYPHCSSTGDPAFEVMGLRLAPGSSRMVHLKYRPFVDIANLFKPNKLVLRPFIGPIEGPAHVVEYWITNTIPPIEVVVDTEPVSASALEARIEETTLLPAVLNASPVTLADVGELGERTVVLNEVSLSLHNAIITHTYSVPADVSSVRFVLYHPLAANIQLHVYENNLHVGWADDLGDVEIGFPAIYSGATANPESVEVPQAGGRTFTVEVRLIAANSTLEFPIRLEAEEQPVRPGAVLAVEPMKILAAVDVNTSFSLSATIAEASHQHPLQGVTATMSSLENETGKVLRLRAAETPATYVDPIIPAGTRRSYEWRFDESPDCGTYTGTVTYTSNTGSIAQDVEVTVGDTVPPVITCPPHVAITCGQPTTPEATGWATATDNTDQAPAIVYSDVATSTTCLSDPVLTRIDRTWTATDSCGNSSNCVQTITVLKVVTSLDIKPGSCPNPLNRRSRGVVPVCLLGTAGIDVRLVDLASIRLSRADCVGGSVAPYEGPPGPHSVIEDVGTPFDGLPCACHELGGDGVPDLSMHFETDNVVAALELDALSPGALVELVVTGTLTDGCEFIARDCVRLVPPNAAQANLTIRSTASGAWFDVTPLDLQLDGGGFAKPEFARAYPETSVVTVTAASSFNGRPFVGWKVNGLMQSPTSESAQITMLGNQELEAVYRVLADLDDDNDVDMNDLGMFETCASGPGIPHGGSPVCLRTDFDTDNDVDQSDFALFQRCYSGESVPADPNCGN